VSTDGEPQAAPADVEDPRVESVMREVSRAMVKLYKEQFARGPETVFSRYGAPNVIISILGGSLTPVVTDSVGLS
jgi:uncharacterized protein YbcI